MRAELLHSSGVMWVTSIVPAGHECPLGADLGDPSPASPKPGCECQARTFSPRVRLANTLTELLSAVPVLVIAVFGKRKVTLRFLAGVDRSRWHKATFLRLT